MSPGGPVPSSSDFDSDIGQRIRDLNITDLFPSTPIPELNQLQYQMGYRDALQWMIDLSRRELARMETRMQQLRQTG